MVRTLMGALRGHANRCVRRRHGERAASIDERHSGLSPARAIGTAALVPTVRSTFLSRDTRIALGLNLGCDLGDLIATLLGWRGGELSRGATLASVALQSASMATWTTVLRAGDDLG